MAKLSKEELISRVAEATGSGIDSLDQITPEDLTAISFGQGTLFNLDRNLDLLDAFAQEVKDGERSITDFFELAQPIAQEANRILNASGEQGFGRIGRVRKFAQLDTPSGLGQFEDVKIPFSSREFQSLPDEVLPSIQDINEGRIPVDLLPPGAFERVQRATPVPEVTSQPFPTDGQLPQPGQPVTFVPDPANPGSFIPTPVVGDVPGQVVPQTVDQAIIEAEARRQEEQQRRAFVAAQAARERGLTETEEFLKGVQERQFGEFVPQASEQLQTRGLLQTSELENVLGREQARLGAQRQETLGQLRLGASQAEIDAINNILGRRQQLQGAGLQRRFSIEDFERQEALARQLGAETTPQVSGGGKGGVSGALTGAASGAAGGAAIGSIIPGVGTAIGGGIGAILGGGAGSGLIK